MSVLSCGRRDCRSIMCDRYSSTHGYICRECFEELISLGSETNISLFMRTSCLNRKVEASRARFEVEFPLNDLEEL